MTDDPSRRAAAASTARDPRRVHVAAPPDGGVAAPPPRDDLDAPSEPRAPRVRTAPVSPAPPSRRPPTPTPAARPAPAKRRRRRRWPLVVGALVVLLVASALGGYLWASSIFDRIEKIPLGDTLSTGGNGTNYLIVGSDSRASIDPDDPNAGAFLGDGDPGGQRSDTMLLLHIDGDGASMLSIPRDLYVTIAETGSSQKINAAFNGGPPRLVATVQQALDVPVHHYLEVDFVSFAGLVDAIGGVEIEFEHPAFDTASGLNVTESGMVELDGTQALAYVRSRHYVEVVDGQERRDFTADLGRIERQQAFLRAVLGELGSSKNPISLGRVASKMAGGLRIDDQMSLLDAMRFAWRMRGLDPESLQLPVDGGRNASGSVLFLRTEEAQPILDEFR